MSNNLNLSVFCLFIHIVFLVIRWFVCFCLCVCVCVCVWFSSFEICDLQFFEGGKFNIWVSFVYQCCIKIVSSLLRLQHLQSRHNHK